MGAIDGPVAFVTGASRGIGKAVAIAFAEAGYDVAITARSQVEGEEREHSSTVRETNTRPLPGSLQSTAEAITATGRSVLAVPSDLMDLASVGAATAVVLERWGRVDVLVNNGRYVGPGHMDLFLDTPVELIERHITANVVSPLHILKMVLPGMLERGNGTVITMTSGAGYADPPAPAGAGGWGMGYSVSKGALHRVAGVLAVEHAEQRHPLLQREPRRCRHGAHQGGHGRLRLRRRPVGAARSHRRRPHMAGDLGRRAVRRHRHQGPGALGRPGPLPGVDRECSRKTLPAKA